MSLRLGLRAKFYSAMVLLLLLLLVFETINDRASLRRHFLSGATHNAREMAIEAASAGTIVLGVPGEYRLVPHPLLTGIRGHEEVSPGSEAFQVRLLQVRDGEIPGDMRDQFDKVRRNGVDGASVVNEEGAKKWLRYMLPVRAEKRCLNCHGDYSSIPAFLKTADGSNRRLFGFRSGETMAVISVTVSLDEMEREFQENFESTLLFSGGFEIVIILVFAFLTHRLILLPVRRLTESLQHLDETGRFTAVPVVSEDEIGTLTRSYNNMMAEVSRLLVQRHDSEKRYAAVIEMVPMPIVTFTSDGKIVLFNAAAATVFSLDREQSVGEDFFALFRDPDEVRRTVASFMAKKPGCRGHVQARLAVGRDIMFHISVSPAEFPLVTAVVTASEGYDGCPL